MTLYLLPNVLGHPVDYHEFLPRGVADAIKQIEGLIAESETGGRRYLKHFQTKQKLENMPIALLDDEINFLLEPLLQGQTWGIVSDAGLPCIADPGALLVRKAKEKGVRVKAFSGPNALMLALMQSGLNGQQFYFHGYIPKDISSRQKALLEWQKQTDVTHIFIEAPYRNIHTMEACLQNLDDETLLSIASNLTLPDEWAKTMTIKKWKNEKDAMQHIQKKPAVFLFLAPFKKDFSNRIVKQKSKRR